MTLMLEDDIQSASEVNIIPTQNNIQHRRLRHVNSFGLTSLKSDRGISTPQRGVQFVCYRTCS